MGKAMSSDILSEESKLIFKLQVYQAELEAQRNQLLDSYANLEESRNQYVDLYNHTKTSYISLTKEGMVQKANLSALNLLGKNFTEIFGKRFTAFINPEYTDIWHLFFKSILNGESLEGIQLCLFNEELIEINYIMIYQHLGTPIIHLEFSNIIKCTKEIDEIKNLAFYDPLTQLPNRRLLNDRLELAMEHSKRNGELGALIFIDIDNFKNLNDTYGHDIGDSLLQKVSLRLKQLIRGTDTLARLGGDEFVILLGDLSSNNDKALEYAKNVGNKILDSFRKPFSLKNSIINHHTASIGITIFNDHAETFDVLLKQADIAMYEAKKNGRDNLCFFNKTMQDDIEAKFYLENELRSALKKKQLMVYYQPQLDKGSRIVGVEALIRWFHPIKGFISPAEFIPVSENSNLILDIGQFVLETVGAQLKLWKSNKKTRELQIAVNISAKQLQQTDFVDNIKSLISSYDIDPDKLKLELTETSLQTNLDDVHKKITELKAIGIKFALDDFGTGYSSLYYLTQLPIDQLKIDQSFIQNLGVRHNDDIITCTIIAMGLSLNMEVIAEGVETEKQRLFLEQQGCYLTQGYLFSKPVPIDQLELLIMSKKNKRFDCSTISPLNSRN